MFNEVDFIDLRQQAYERTDKAIWCANRGKYDTQVDFLRQSWRFQNRGRHCEVHLIKSRILIVE